MVIKEDVCEWFKHLSPHKRIDYMCGMLEMCLPMELRFLGSYVEDLAKKDFHQLRDSEGKANSRHELSKFRESDGRAFRNKMAVYLALLHSSNSTCSSIIFQLLEKHVQDALTVIDSMDSMTVYNILLVLSMAMNHPAFSYHQKSRMYDYYRAANEAAERILEKREPELLILTESCDLRSCDQGVSPMCSPNIAQLHLHSPVPMSQQHQHLHVPVEHEVVHVCGIEVKAARNKETETKTTEYTLQVTWSNGEKRTVFKTYQELCDFHKKLRQTFPDELSHQNAIKLPVIKATSNHKKENLDQLNRYTCLLLDLPEDVRQSQLFNGFFGSPSCHRPNVKMADACTSPRPHVLPDGPIVQHLTNSGEEDSVIGHQYTGHPRTQALYTSYLPHSPVNGDVCSLSPHSPVHHELAYHASSHSPFSSTKTTSPLISSPCHSPGSSLESLANSQPGSPSMKDRENRSVQADRRLEPTQKVHVESSQENIPGTQLDDAVDGSRYGVVDDEAVLQNVDSTGSLSNFEQNEVTNMLKHTHLAKFADKFLGFSFLEFVHLSLEDIEARCDSSRTMAAQIKQFVEETYNQDKEPELNGMIAQPIPHVMWPHVQMYAPPGMVQPYQFSRLPLFQYPPILRDDGILSRVQDSPTNSENSSPSPSPRLPTPGALRKHLQKRVTDSSSDDGEGDKQSGQQRGTKWKTHSAPNSARGDRQEKAGDAITDTYPTDKVDTYANNAGHKGMMGNGYTSDPTFTRPLMLKGSHKAQPAHTNSPLSHMNYLVNMPDNSFKGGTQAFTPMVLPQHMRNEVTMTSNSGHFGYMSPAELTPRPAFYLPNTPQMLTRSHVNPMVPGPRPVLPPGIMTTSSAMNPQCMPPGHPSASGNGGNGKVFPLSPVAVQPPAQVVQGPPVTISKTPSGIINGMESASANSVPVAEPCVNRSQLAPQPVVNSLTSNSVTYTSNSLSLANNQSGFCSSCGHQTHPNNVAVMPSIQGIWPGQYSNGFVQMPMANLHHYYAPNGFSNPHLYGVTHSNSPMVSGVQNVIYNGCNSYSNSVKQPGSYCQKKPKKLTCFNCGASSHLADDCPENSMEYMSGPNMFQYEPKSNLKET